MQNDDNNTFSGEIKVASRIIDYLSSGLYHTPAACLKELVNNSYDARAKRVNIFVKPDADRIIIEDDGDGMNKDEFQKHFDRVSESHKRDGNDITEGDTPRPKIGKIGIGFIAANELCDVLEVFSTKEGSEELLHVEINFKKMRDPIEERRRDGELVVKADYKGEILKANKEDHYTQLFLTEVREPVRDILDGANSYSSIKSEAISLYGLKSENVGKILKNPNLSNWKEFNIYSETMLNIGLNVPVRYHENWIPLEFKNLVKGFEETIEKLDFNVFYDGTDLKKPIVFNPPNESMLIDIFEFSGEYVSATGYFYAQHGTVKPNDIQGLLVRIRQAAVGEYDHTFWDFSPSESSLIQRWVSCEIWADDRLEDAMNIDRRTLRIAHPAYTELRNAIHTHLREVLRKATKELYKAGSDERKKEKTEKFVKSVNTFVRETVAPISLEAAKTITSLVNKSASSKNFLKRLERMRWSNKSGIKTHSDKMR
jgi:Histidine kinase-, DNA gyrase B-, and HSP90-like ATPase